jgi:hypothetical protein
MGENFPNLRTILNFTPGPQGWILSPRGNVHPFVHPQGWTLYYLEEWRGKKIISPPWDNFKTSRDKIHPWRTTPPLGVKFAPRDIVFLNKRAGVFHECFPEEKHLHFRSQLQTKADVNRAHKKFLPLTKNITSDRFNFSLKLFRPTRLLSLGA